jgi:hypothetical protein
MPVGMPAANEDDLFAGHGVTFERLNDQPMVSHASRWHPAALHFTIGFWSGAAAAVLVMVWLR